MSSLKNDVREIYLGLFEACRSNVKELRDYLKGSWQLLLIATVALFVAWFYVNPPPPTRIYLSSSGSDSIYELMSKKYAAFFAKQGITLTLVSTHDEQGNIEFVGKPQKNGSHVTFAQAGIYDPVKYENLQSLGSIAYEPIWFFYRRPAIDPSDFNGSPEGFAKILQAKIWLGKPGSASYAQALNILKALGLVL